MIRVTQPRFRYRVESGGAPGSGWFVVRVEGGSRFFYRWRETWAEALDLANAAARGKPHGW